MESGAGFDRRTFLAASAACLLYFGFKPGACAEAPMAGFQAPGFYRMMLGEFEITAVFDGFMEMGVERLHDVPEAEIRALLARTFVGVPWQTSVNTYLVNTGSKLVLIDAGGGSLYGEALGKLPKNLEAAGYRPNQIDIVLMTHIHGDHAGGLIDSAGKPVFTNAVLLVSKTESDYWLSDSEAQKAGPKFGRFFDLAHRVKATYGGRWQTFDDGQVLPGFRATVVPGHTPGHTVFEISSGGRSFMIMGDTVHCAAVQFARPEITFEFDSDPVRAAAVRKTLFKSLAESRVLAAGMHIPFPGVGRVLDNGNGAYAWIPVEFSPVKK